jgi:transmembrane protein EpsG
MMVYYVTTALAVGAAWLSQSSRSGTPDSRSTGTSTRVALRSKPTGTSTRVALRSKPTGTSTRVALRSKPTGTSTRVALRSKPTGTSTRVALRSKPTGTSKFWALVSASILVAVAALRWQVGTDYSTYNGLYAAYKATSWGDYSLFSEPGIRVLARLASWIHDDSAVMFALASLVTVGLTVRTIYRHSPMFALSVLLYVITGAWQGSFNGVRQYLACAIMFAGHRYVIDRKFTKYILVVILATLFHVSALVMVFLWFVPLKRMGTFRAAGLMIVATLGLTVYSYATSVINFLKGGSVDIGAGAYFERQVNPLRVAMAFIPLVLYMALTRRDRLDPKAYFYVNMGFINAAVMIAVANSAYLARFAIYTNIFSILLIPRLLNMRDRRLAAIAGCAVVTLYCVSWYLDTVQVGGSLANFSWIINRK